MALPTQAETEASLAFEKWIDQHQPLPSAADEKRVAQILHRLQKIVQAWITNLAIKQGNGEAAAKDGEFLGRLVPFGSHRLGVRTSKSDMDVLCIAPKWVDRTSFFSVLVKTHLAKQPGLTNLICIEDAFVPVIKFTLDGLEMDLLLAILRLPTIGHWLDVHDDRILALCDDDVSARSLGGLRSTVALLDSVPNVSTFQIALRAVKLWATRRGVQSNVLGYPGGIGWAIFTARTCQLFPNATPLAIFWNFFRLFHRWKWPMSIVLCNPLFSSTGWNEEQTNKDLMPLLTPCYPTMNATHNVGKSTFFRIQQEVARVAQLAEQSQKDFVTAMISGQDAFFTAHRNYIQVDVLFGVDPAQQEEAQYWKGWVESRLRQLVLLFEQEQESLHYLVQPWPGRFDLASSSSERTDDVKDKEGKTNNSKKVSFFFGLLDTSTTTMEKGQKRNLGKPILEFRTLVMTKYSRQLLPGMDVQVVCVPRSLLPKAVLSSSSAASASASTSASASSKQGTKRPRDENTDVAATTAGETNNNNAEESATKRARVL